VYAFISRLAFDFKLSKHPSFKILSLSHRDLCICIPEDFLWPSNIFQLIGTLFIAFFPARVPPVPAPPLTWWRKEKFTLCNNMGLRVEFYKMPRVLFENLTSMNRYGSGKSSCQSKLFSCKIFKIFCKGLLWYFST
jgi:hypothetical protein